MKPSNKPFALSYRLWAVCYLLCSASVYAFNSHQPFDISSDVLDYNEETQEITAEGHVVIIQSSSSLHADVIRYDRLHQRLIARGNVSLREKGGVMLGDQMDYDLIKEEGMVMGGKGYGSPWFFQGVSWEKKLDYYVGRNASFTSCDLIDPHYHIRSSRVHLIPDRLFWAWNNVFYVDDHAVMYTPFMYKFLGPRRVVFQVQPGNDSVKGAFAKTTTTFRIKDKMYDRVFLDHYTDSGTGYGNEFDYDQHNYRGSLFGYYIDPKGTPELAGAPRAPQYNIRFYHWQKVNNELTFQSNINHRKNVSFNNQFFPQDTNQSASNYTNSIAFTHQKGVVNQRVVMEAQQDLDSGADPLFGDLHTQSASFPRYEVTVFQIPIWSPTKPSTSTFRSTFISTSTVFSTSTVTSSSATVFYPLAKPAMFGPILLSASGSGQEYYSRADETNRTRLNGGFSLGESIILSRRLSFSPSVSPSIRWQDKYDPFTPPVGSSATVIPIGIFRGYQGRLSTANTLRFRASSALTLDQNYTWTARMEPNGASLDRSLVDGGIETHRLAWLLYWRPSRTTQLRSFSGYDMRVLADEDPNLFRQRRVDPLSNELTYEPRGSRWEYFFRHALGYYPTRTLAWETDVRGHFPHKTYWETGLIYGTRGFLTWNNKVGLYASPGWRVDTILNTIMPNDSLRAARNGVVTQSEFVVTRDVHCWEVQFLFRNRPPFTREYSLLFNLKLGAKAAKQMTNEELESQFYPWRGGDSAAGTMR